MSDNSAVGNLAVLSIGRVFMRSWEKTGEWTTIFYQSTRQIHHVVDWLTSAVLDGDAWLRRVDPDGRPLKLTKMHSMEQLVSEADKAFAKKMQKVGKAAALPGDERLHMALAGDFSVVRMLTPEALDRESSVMQHCVGLGSYDRHLDDDRRGLFSLRDALNRPHATIEVDMESKALLQLRGKQNELPIAKYLRLLAPFIEAEGLKSGETASMGFAIGRGGIVHHLSEIPDGAEFDETLSLCGYGDDPKNVRLPSGIRVDGDLVLQDGFQNLLTKAAIISGDVHARSLDLPDISPDFVFGGGLDLEESRLGKLPDGLHIRGDLVLKHCLGVVLPRRLVIDGDLHLAQADVLELPDDLVIKGSLYAGDSRLTRLPADLAVGGGVFLGGTKLLEEIPAGFSVGGNLMLRDSSVRHIGDGVVVGGMVSINADVAGQLDVAASAEIGGGFYFRPTGRVRTFEGRSSMTADEFRSTTASEIAPRRRAAGFG
ncbi:hypothetical protein HFO56_01415 [Rhizobium laguerreae]|uniref:PcfJ domain-containing protein n=1 Tax=Rhizobium laguerreae TaxID=1076926 RepID=UPI001C921BC9|nr:PcfJ domain-containing protein [Rhizobium laguerreae]MBY3151068.1 hypothetical protein [Rhizobium laguerreae]